MNVVIQPFHPRLDLETQKRAAALADYTDHLLTVVDQLDETPRDRASGTKGNVVLAEGLDLGQQGHINRAQLKSRGENHREARIETDLARYEVKDKGDRREIRISTHDREGYRSSLKTITVDMESGHLVGFAEHGYAFGRRAVEGLKEPMVWVLGGPFAMTAGAVALAATGNAVAGLAVGIAAMVGIGAFAHWDSVSRPYEGRD
ncbi:MAG: hypothetical protein AMXMBFR33_58750 [Candidatus Xenobia bacterium]